MSESNWGKGKTEYFYKLSPDRVLDATENLGVHATGRLLQLNSMENRVYEVEIDIDESKNLHKWSNRKIVKFYRPGRWSLEQILDEHKFLDDLQEEGIPVAAAQRFENGSTIKTLDDLGIFCSVFARIGGRNPDELTLDQFESIGRLLARLHNVGESKVAEHRLSLDTTTFGTSNLSYIVDQGLLPLDLKSRYVNAFEEILYLTEPHLNACKFQRIHGDCHMGNVLIGSDGIFFVDFDDMLNGPVIQDVWLLTPGRDEYSRKNRAALIEGYELLRTFDHSQIKLVESLRSMRFVHFSAWIGKRIEDPYFKKTFEDYGSWNYWNEQLRDLEDQLVLVREALGQ